MPFKSLEIENYRRDAPEIAEMDGKLLDGKTDESCYKI